MQIHLCSTKRLHGQGTTPLFGRRCVTRFLEGTETDGLQQSCCCLTTWCEIKGKFLSSTGCFGEKPRNDIVSVCVSQCDGCLRFLFLFHRQHRRWTEISGILDHFLYFNFLYLVTASNQLNIQASGPGTVSDMKHQYKCSLALIFLTFRPRVPLLPGNLVPRSSLQYLRSQQVIEAHCLEKLLLFQGEKQQETVRDFGRILVLVQFN